MGLSCLAGKAAGRRSSTGRAVGLSSFTGVYARESI